MKSALDNIGADAWHICPGPYLAQAFKRPDLSTQQKADAEKLRNESQNPNRPTKSYWGDPIPQMTFTADNVAIVPVSGILLKGATWSDKYFFNVAGYEDILEDLETARTKGARAALLLVSSGGGMVTGCDETAQAIAKMVKAGFPVHTLTETMRCSAAEYITAPCALRLSTPSAIVGSIGTVMQVLKLNKWYEQVGAEFHFFTSGDKKAMTEPAKPMEPEHKEFLQGFVDRRGAEFRDWMTRHRDIPADAMEGQFFTGAEGAAVGLVDVTVQSQAEALGLI